MFFSKNCSFTDDKERGLPGKNAVSCRVVLFSKQVRNTPRAWLRGSVICSASIADILGTCVLASHCAIQHVAMKLNGLVRYNSQTSEHCSKVLTVTRSAMHTLDSLFTRAWPGVGGQEGFLAADCVCH